MALLQTQDEIDDVEEELPPPEYDIWQMPVDYTLEVLFTKWQKGEIAIPDFQRDYVWNQTQASRLIDSFIMGLPVPPVFLFVDENQKLLIIDGMQRLKSIFDFFNGYLEGSNGRQRPFELTGIHENSRLCGKTFDQLDEEDQLKLKNTALRAIQIKQHHPPGNPTSIYHIFERLNTGGTKLRQQEVRHCIYSGKLNDLLTELNRTEAWREIIGNHVTHKRKKDVELILRYMALFHQADEYKKPMMDFLSNFMAQHQDPPDEFIEAERRRFGKTCRVILEKLGSKPFGRIIRHPVFDSVFVAFAKHIDGECPTDIARRMKSLLDNAEFVESSSHTTTDPARVRTRLHLAEKILFA